MSALVSPHVTGLLLQILPTVFLAILFLQSGLDKVVDRKGNLAWLTGHFAKSPLCEVVPTMLAVITVMEVGAGLVSAVGAGALVIGSGPELAFLGAALSALSLTGLFFGQRIAKDYAGAAALVPYFLLTLVAMYLERGA